MADPIYDAAGNMTSTPSSGTTYTLKYDAWNRLVEIADEFSVQQTNEYDGLGRRTESWDESTDTTDHLYYNDDWQLLTVDNSDDDTPDAIYYWHPHYIDALGVRMRASDTHFFLHDANFNVTAAVDNNGDAVVERYSYTPYGEVTVLE